MLFFKALEASGQINCSILMSFCQFASPFIPVLMKFSAKVSLDVKYILSIYCTVAAGRASKINLFFLVFLVFLTSKITRQMFAFLYDLPTEQFSSLDSSKF